MERKDKKLVENAGTDIMDQALGPTRGAPHVLFSGQRAGRDTALLQKREKAKGNSIKNFFALTLHEANAPGLPVRTLQSCASLLHAQILTDASLNLTSYQNKLPPELNLS